MIRNKKGSEKKRYRLPGLVYRYYPMFAVAIIILAWLTLRGGK